MTDNVNIKLDGNKLKEFNKTFDGLPILHFRKIFYIPFLMALGSIIMDGVPLLRQKPRFHGHNGDCSEPREKVVS